MLQDVDISSIVEKARRRGHFDFNDFPGLRLSFEQLGELTELLRKKKIPFGTQDVSSSFSKQEAVEIITSLRRGVPPSTDVTKFSVGRHNLMDAFKKNLEIVARGKSMVSFMNADYGCGKTHSLHVLRELAFKRGFVVSIVTLSQNACPIHDFMTVYDKVIWNIRTQRERVNPALENVLDSWLTLIRELGEETARALIHGLPEDLKCALHAYHESISPIRPNEEKRLLVLNYLSGKSLYLRDIRRLGIQERIDSSNALQMLGHMSELYKNLKYRGICILFDEADPIHSFARIEHKDQAYSNLFRIIRNSQQASNCYFFYATTPSFFDYYSYYWPSTHKIESKDILELERLSVEELQSLASNICGIYSIYRDQTIPDNLQLMLRKACVDPLFSDSLGNFVRRCIALLDEKL